MPPGSRRALAWTRTGEFTVRLRMKGKKMLEISDAVLIPLALIGIYYVLQDVITCIAEKMAAQEAFMRSIKSKDRK